MQHDFALSVQHLLRRMRDIHPTSEVVTLRAPEEVTRTSYGNVFSRVHRLAHALQDLGLGLGDRAATFMHNSQEHFELYLGIPAYGGVVHTVNIRLSERDISYIINHAEDRVVFVDADLVPLLAKIAPELRTVEHFVVAGGDADASALDLLPNARRYEELLDEQLAGEFALPELDERAAAGLCYTSGTTGRPKGVLYSHRSTLLHTLAAECAADGVGISAKDRVLPIVPMFHANAWGQPYAAALTGADLVFPFKFLQPEPLAWLIESERVTVASAVPTVWVDFLDFADAHHPDLHSLRCVPCGGAAVPPSLMRGLQERHDVTVMQGWGMTEMSPLAAAAWAPRGTDGDEEWRYRAMAGRVLPLVEARVVDEDGAERPRDGKTPGELEVRGAYVASAYYRDDTPGSFREDWLRTGDIASIDDHGFIQITDRAKDVIKSGGEWISSVELENELMEHPGVREAAVVGRRDERWTERPVACIVPAEGYKLHADEIVQHLESRVAKWWIPDEFIVVKEIPRTSVGKMDKKELRHRFDSGRLDGSSLGSTTRHA